jgi:hypothetical protein
MAPPIAVHGRCSRIVNCRPAWRRGGAAALAMRGTRVDEIRVGDPFNGPGDPDASRRRS